MSRKRSPWRPSRRLLWIAGALLVLVVGAGAAVAIALPPARLRALVQSQIAQALERDVRFEDARLGLWPPVRLTVAQPALAEPGGFERGSAFEARSIHLDLDLLAALTGRVRVHRLELDRPAIHLVFHPDGRTNFDDVIKKPEAGRPGSKPMDLEIRQVVIHEGRALLDDLEAARRIAATVDARLGLRSERGGTRFATSGKTQVAGLAVGPLSAARLSDLDQSLAKLEWRVEHDGKWDAESRRLALERLILGFGRAEIAVSGLVQQPGPKGSVDLKARGRDVDLGEVLGFLAAANAKALSGIRASGRMDFDLGLKGATAPGRLPSLTGALRVRGGGFRYPGAKAGVDALSFTARFAPDSLGIGDLQARISGQPIQARLAMTRFEDPMVAFAVRGNVDLAAVAPLVAPKETKLSGRAAVDVRGRGRAKDAGSIALEGNARLADVSVEAPDLPRKVESIQGTIAFLPARATVRGLSAKAGASSFTLDASIARPLALMAAPGTVAPAGVQFTLRSPHLDLEELLPATPGAPIVPNASGQGTVAIGRLKNKKLDVAAVAARLELDPGVVTVPEYSFAGYGGTVSGSARFDLTDTAKPIYAVKASAEKLDADAALSAWTPARGWLHGALNSSIDLSAQGITPIEVAKTLTAAGVASIGQGQLGPGPALEAIASFVKIPSFKKLKIRDGSYPFTVERGKVRFREVTFGGPTGDWRLAGAVGFDGSLDYAVSITLPPELVAGLDGSAAAASGALTDDQGRLLLDLRVTGTAKKPKVAWDRQAMLDRLKGRISQTLLDQKEKIGQEVLDAALERRRAAEDSVKAVAKRTRKAIEDSLRRRAEDVIKGFFGAARDSAP